MTMTHSPATTELQALDRHPSIPDLGFVCQACGGRTRSQLNAWAQWHTAGDQWREKCYHCGVEWWLTLTSERIE